MTSTQQQSHEAFGFLVGILFSLITIWTYQEFSEEIPSKDIQTAQEACAVNGGLDYIRHELFESSDYVCKNGAEGVISVYEKRAKEKAQ